MAFIAPKWVSRSCFAVLMIGATAASIIALSRRSSDKEINGRPSSAWFHLAAAATEGINIQNSGVTPHEVTNVIKQNVELFATESLRRLSAKNDSWSLWFKVKLRDLNLIDSFSSSQWRKAEAVRVLRILGPDATFIVPELNTLSNRNFDIFLSGALDAISGTPTNLGKPDWQK